MKDWRSLLRVDPVLSLLASGNPALELWVHRDLLGETKDVTELWELSQAQAILGRQQPDGRWHRAGSSQHRSAENYDQLETLRQLSILVAKYGFTREHPSVAAAVDYLTGFQTSAGDFRGIYGNQYTPYYTAAITELFIRTGYEQSQPVERAMQWLIAIRQDDGGWALPTRTVGLTLKAIDLPGEPVEPDRRQPSAHLVTGIVLRAFAAHSTYRHAAEAHQAGDFLKHQFFQPDNYADHKAASSWLVFSYPFWWTDLLSSLDTLTRLGFTAADPAIAEGVAWFIEHQDPTGLWNVGHNRPKGADTDAWVKLAVCRMLQRVEPR